RFAPAVLLSPPPLHPVLDGRMAPAVGLDVPRRMGVYRPGGAANVRGLPVPGHPERVVLRHQRRRLPVTAPGPPRLCACAPCSAALVCLGTAGAWLRGGVCAGSHSD